MVWAIVDCKAVLFFESAIDVGGIAKGLVRIECRDSKEGWGEKLKIMTVYFADIKFIQNNYPFFQQQEIPIGL